MIWIFLLFSWNCWAGSPQRVISLSPALTEMLYELGFENKLAGVSEFSDYPPQAKEKPSVGPYTKPSIEKIVNLNPDLVFLNQEGPQDTLFVLKRFRVPFKVVTMRTLDEIGSSARVIAEAMGEPEKGNQFEKKWNSSLKKAFSKNKPRQVSVLIEVESTPLVIAGKKTFLDEIVSGCGGQNLFKEMEGYPKISQEIVLTKKPDLILLADYFDSDRKKKGALEYWEKLPHTREVPKIFLDPDTTSRPGPRLIKGVESICAILSRKTHAK